MPESAPLIDAVRYAGRLHDEVAQPLIAARMQLELLAAGLGPGEPPAAYDAACEALDDAMRAVRRLMTDLGEPPDSGNA